VSCTLSATASPSEVAETESISVISLSQMYDAEETSVQHGASGTALPTARKATATGAAITASPIKPTVGGPAATETTSEIGTSEDAEEEEEGEEIEESGMEFGSPVMIKESLVKLWAYKYPVTIGRNVSCMVWSRTNPVTEFVCSVYELFVGCLACIVNVAIIPIKITCENLLCAERVYSDQ